MSNPNADLVKDVTKALIKGKECKALLREFRNGSTANYARSWRDWWTCDFCFNSWGKHKVENHKHDCLITRINEALKEE